MRHKLSLVLVLLLISSLAIPGLLAGNAGKAEADSGWTYKGLGAGDIRCLAYNPTDLKIYAVSNCGNVYRYDGGMTWVEVGNLGLNATSLIYNPSDAKLYVGCGDGHVYRHEDGTTWVDTGDVSAYWINSLAYNTADSKLYTACSEGIYRYDGGTTWATVGRTSQYPNCLVYNPSDSKLYAGCDYGHVYRYDGGTTWADAGDTGALYVTSLAFNPSDSKLYAGCGDVEGELNGHIYRYDGGTTWADTGGYWVNSLAYNPSDSKLFAVGNGGHIYRYDGGTTWTDVEDTGLYSSLAYNPSDSKLYSGGNDGRIYRYDGGTTWADTGGGRIDAPVINLTYNPTDSKLYAGCLGNHIYRYDGGTTWTAVGDTGPGVECLAYNPSDSKLYAGCGNHIYRYDGGTTWASTGDVVGYWVSSLAYNPSDAKLYAACNDYASEQGHVFRYDGGTTWTEVGDTGPGVECLVYNPSDSKLYAGCDGGHVYRHDGGTTWADTGVVDADWVNSLAYNPSDSKLYAGGGDGHVYRYDGGTTWASTGDVVGYWVSSLAYNPSDAKLYAACNDYASERSHVYRYDGGMTWSDTGSTSYSVTTIKYNPADSKLYTGGDGGVFIYNGTTSSLSIQTAAATPVNTTGATLNGNITDTGGENADSRGFQYKVQGTSTWSDWHEDGSYTTGTYSHAVTGLSPNTSYDFQAYAHNSAGTSYGDTLSFKTAAPPKPSISKISPTSGTVGAKVTIKGVNFGTSRGSSYVKFNNTKCENSNYISWGDNKIEIEVPTGSTSGSVKVTTSVGTSNGINFNVISPPPPPPPLSVNPNVTSISPSYGPPGTIVTITGSNFGNSRGAGSVKSAGNTGSGASYVSFNGVKATEYPLWTNTKIKAVVPDGAGAGPVWVVTGVGTSNKTKTFNVETSTWYLAEGSTNYGFDCYITIENPNTSPVTAQITYMTGSGPVTAPSVTLPAKSQATINPKDVVGNNDFSTKVVCKEGKSLAVDRTMSWTGPGAASPEAHSSIGVTSPGKTWYLPEGSSKWGFECYLLIQNPNAGDASCTVTYMVEGEGPKTVTKSVPASSRKTFNIADDIGEKDASIKVESTQAVIPERAMYRNNRREGHDSIGTTSPAQDFYLAEGTSAYGFTTYVLIQNPNAEATDVTVTYMTPTGPQPQAAFTMSPNSRKTIRVNDVLPNTDFSTKVHGTKPVIAERAMYWGADTPLGEACHDSVGMAQPHANFFLPDGQTSEGRETWTLVQNPNDQAVEVEISYLTPNGQGNVVFSDTIPANSRRTYNMADKGIGERAAVMVRSLTSGKKIIVERAMYWNSRGAGTDTIGGYGD